ncbi:fimbrial protein [Orbus hercynius]|uniref:Fimbrial protein n=1 Tax=Orbus hercynius TaxID=593135 RepID=A0A495RCD0_9GAMM|nr:fimbrial protein [Orbus hercynius]RKS85122.1 fimbrial protein [Orbus hercynius]
MKKLFFIVVMLFYAPHAFSFVCYDLSTGKEIKSNGTVSVPIYINSNIVRGENIFGNVGDYLACQNQQPYFYVDHMELKANGITPGAAISHLDNGVYINGARILSTNTPKTNIFSIADNNIYPLDINMFFVVPNTIGSSLVISPGETLMTLRLYKYSTSNSSHGYEGVQENFTWVFVAANRAALQAGNCDINNNEPINIDFGLVPKSMIKNSSAESISKAVDLNINCHDNSLYNQQIKITLSAQPVTFSDNAIVVSDNANLGIEISHNNTLVKPNGSFMSIIDGGMSNESLNISVIKNPNVSSENLSSGRFNASASLITSLP